MECRPLLLCGVETHDQRSKQNCGAKREVAEENLHRRPPRRPLSAIDLYDVQVVGIKHEEEGDEAAVIAAAVTIAAAVAAASFSFSPPTSH